MSVGLMVVVPEVVTDLVIDAERVIMLVSVRVWVRETVADCETLSDTVEETVKDRDSVALRGMVKEKLRVSLFGVVWEGLVEFVSVIASEIVEVSASEAVTDSDELRAGNVSDSVRDSEFDQDGVGDLLIEALTV